MAIPGLTPRHTNTITVFGSSRPMAGEPEYERALELGREFARAGYNLCNGGYGGTMEATARGMKELAGRTGDSAPLTIGVTCRIFGDRKPNQWIDREIVTHSLPERLTTLVDQGDGYVVLKGSTGTLLEFAAVWELTNKRFIEKKPIVLLGDFWLPLVDQMIKELSREGLAEPSDHIAQASTAGECISQLEKQWRRLRNGTGSRTASSTPR